jgi:hypothetical protein
VSGQDSLENRWYEESVGRIWFLGIFPAQRWWLGQIASVDRLRKVYLPGANKVVIGTGRWTSVVKVSSAGDVVQSGFLDRAGIRFSLPPLHGYARAQRLLLYGR